MQMKIIPGKAGTGRFKGSQPMIENGEKIRTRRSRNGKRQVTKVRRYVRTGIHRRVNGSGHSAAKLRPQLPAAGARESGINYYYYYYYCSYVIKLYHTIVYYSIHIRRKIRND